MRYGLVSFFYIVLFYVEAKECNECFVINITAILFDYNIV